ncbi:MAG: ABC transporter ATP-binding protein [Bacteroidetes bacterium]|nr:MAG: ABC transporter ATP-binding protein [Bacteroidota bacterium]
MIQTLHLEKVYQVSNIANVALEKVNLNIFEGEFVSIMGPSGCGKSTLLNLLALLDQPSSGEIMFMGQKVSDLNDKQKADLRKNQIGFVFQNFNLIDELSVYENVELPLIYLKVSAQARRKRVNEQLEILGLLHKAKFFPQQLSGGQQQKTALARATVAHPKILFADEPTGNLDSVSGEEVMNMLLQLNETGTTIVMVTHSAHNAAYSQRSVHLFDGKIVTEKINQLTN